MGYRSTVALCLSANGQKQLEQLLQQYHDTYPQCTNISTFIDQSEIRKDETPGDIVYLWENTKWYHIGGSELHCPIVFMTKFINDLNVDDYLFVVLGQDDSDVECSGNHCENSLGMRLRREIVFEPYILPV